jgi:hypothetical protein
MAADGDKLGLRGREARAALADQLTALDGS